MQVRLVRSFSRTLVVGVARAFCPNQDACFPFAPSNVFGGWSKEFATPLNFSALEVVLGVEARMPFRPHTANGGAARSHNPVTRAAEQNDLTPEQDYRVRVMGEEELELLRAAATQGGLKLASLNWIIASLANHGFVTINGNDRRLRAVATTAGYLAVARRPVLPDETLH